MIRRVVVATAAVALTAGCGVPVDHQPRDLERHGTSVGSQAPAVPRVGNQNERLYLIKDGKLVRVQRPLQSARTPQQMVTDLRNGPTAAEQAEGYTSALSTMGVGDPVVTQRRATIAIGPPPTAGARSDELLAYGQIVCTLTQGSDVGTVSFTRDGKPLAVPQGDGALSTLPLTIADYADLIGS